MFWYRCTFLSLALAVGAAHAQTPPAADAQTTPEAKSGPKTVSALGIDFSGLIDGYYSFNFNHPASKVNTWRNFDVKADSFALNFAKLTNGTRRRTCGFQA